MRTYALAIAAAILFAFPLSAYSQPIPVAPGDTDPTGFSGPFCCTTGRLLPVAASLSRR